MQSQTQRPLKTFIRAVSIIAVLGIVILIISLKQLIKEQPDEVPVVTPPAQEPQQPSYPPRPPEPNRVFSHNGAILNINTDTKKITIDTLLGDKIIAYTDQTEFVSKRRATVEEKKTLSSAEISTIVSQELPFTGQLRINNTIIAESDKNISGADEFTAVKITLIQ